MSLTKVCGGCDRPARLHPIASDFGTPGCNRHPEDIGFAYWYDGSKETSDYHTINGVPVLIENHEGTPARSRNRLVAIDDDDTEYVVANDDLEVVRTPYGYICQTRWMDKNEHEYSRVSHWSHNGTTPVAYSKGDFSPKFDKYPVLPRTHRGETYFDREGEERTAYVEGHAGFIAKRFIDLVLTEAYTNKLLNVFQDKTTGLLRVGGMRISTNPDGTITSECVTPAYRKVCEGSQTIDPATATPEEMQWYIYVLIAHGNNHAAAWFHDKCDHGHRKQSEHNADCVSMYYKVHHPSCDLERCDYSVATCDYHRNNDIAPLITWLTDDVVTALSEHVSHCINPACDCVTALNREVSALILEGAA